MHMKSFYGNWHTKINIGNIVVHDMAPVNNGDSTAADGFNIFPIAHDDSGILTKSNSYGTGIGRYSLCQTRKSSAFVEVRIDNNCIQQTKARGHSHLAF